MSIRGQLCPGFHAAAKIAIFRVCVCVFFFFIASKTHTEKKKLHRINKVIKRKKKQIANLHTYMAIYLQILNYVTAVLIPYITVLSMIYN